MTNPFDPSPYSDLLAAHSLLRADLKTYCEYVHLTDANENCYSHRAFELLLRASVDFEATAKKIAVSWGIKLPDRPNIMDLSILHDTLKLNDHGVGVAVWHPARRLLFPLKDWNADPHGLYWFRAYNEVKHDRVNQFAKATMLNVVSAIGANFLLLVVVGAISTNPSKHIHHGTTHTEFWYSDQDFTWYKPA